MPEDKPYLQKVYNSLNSAYGAQGSVAKNVFTMSFDDFSNRISSNSGYADKIYNALDAAYGPNGTVKSGAFNSSLDAFKGKVLTLKQATQQSAPQVQEPAQQVQTSAPDPNAALLASGKDLQLPDQKQPGVIADQSAIEPLISAKQQKDDADLQRGKELLTQPKSELAPNMTGASAIPTDQEISIQDKLHQMDEQDKRLHSVQAEADAFAKTTAGGLYYSFVRPVYQSLVGTGGNILAGTTRMAGDLGESMGLDKSKKVLDKVADGLTDYFDFNRLAREGNSSSYLNVTPTSQEGKLSKANILPKAMEAITSMGTLIGGSEVMGGKAGGLFVSNYMSTYEDYHKQARNAGLNNLQADQFAITSAGINSALLMISPETFLGKSKSLPIGESSVFKAIQSGVPIKDAVRNGVKGAMKQLGEANAIVLSTDIANHVLRTGADLMTGEKHFNEHSLAPSMNDALETGILTSIAMGTLNGGRIMKESAPSNMERSAWAQAAEKPELFNNGLQKAVEQGTIHQDRVPQLQQEFTDYKGIYDALKAQVLPKNPNADIPRMALDALKSKMQSEQAKPLSGIPGLKSVNEQVGAEQAKTESDIRDGLIGIPEKGETITSDELKGLMAQSGGEKKSTKLTNNDYKVDEINLGDLYKNDPKFKSYIDNDKLEPNSDKNGLHMPVVVDADGGIVDGMNRLAQQYKNGEKTARAFIEIKPAPVENTASVANEAPTREQQAADIRSDIENSNLSTRDKTKAAKRLNSLLNDPNRSIDQIRERLNKDFGIPIEETRPVEQSNPETQITEPKTIENESPKVEGATKMDVREQAPNGEGMGIGNAEYQVATEQGQPVEAQTEAAQEAVVEPKTVKPKGQEEAKSRRDAAAQRVREEWSNFQNKDRPYQKKGVDLPDPVQDKKLYAAMLNYAKEEILYRANQVKGFAKMKKAQIKSSIRRAMNTEGVKIGISDFTELFDNAYSQIKKIPGVLGNNIDRVSFKEYIKGKIQARDKGRTEGVKAGLEEAKIRVKAVKSAINETIKESGVNLSMLQMRRVVSLLQQSIHGGDIGKSIDRAIDVTTQMVWEAKHKLQISDTKKLIKSVNGLKRSKSMVLQDVEWLRQLQLPAPSRVDDLATYQEMLKDYVTSRKGDNTNPKYTKEEIGEFVQDENLRIHKEKMIGMQGDLDALKEKGVIPADVNLDDYIAMLDNAEPTKLSEGINKKAEILRGDLKTRMEYLKERIPEFDGEEKSVVEKLTNVDISSLDGSELVRLNNVLNNMAEYGSLDAAGDIITSHEARVMNKELAESGDKLRALPTDQILSKKNLSNYISALFYNDGAISRFRAKVLGGIENKTSHVKQRAQKVVKEFVELNKKHKINGLSNAKLHAFSYLNQYRGIESGEIADNINQRLNELVDDATYLFDKGSKYRQKSERNPLIKDATNRLEALKEMGLVDYEITDGKLKVDLKDAIDPDNAHNASEILHSLLTEGEQAVYKFVRDHYDELTDKLRFVTRTYAGKEFQDERNYVSLVSRPKIGAEDRIKDLSESTDITGHLQSINAKPANTTISRSNKKSANIYYDGDFFSNFVNRYYTSLYTAEVLPDLQRTAKLVNSDDFKKFITGQFDIGKDRNTDLNYIKFKEKLADAINEEKYAPFFKKGKQGFADQVISTSIKMTLGNLAQAPRQYLPALLHNLTINNTGALLYALSSRGKAKFNPEYAKGRQEFLQNFTGVQRSALGTAAFDEYVKTVNDDMSWWMYPNQWRNQVGKFSSYALEKADHMAQNDAYISSYITSLIRQGKISSVKGFDIIEAAKNPDKIALAFAEQFASNINSESAKAYRPEVLKDSDKSRLLWMLQGFSLNAYQNAMDKLKIVSDNRSTNAERKEALMHFGGYAGEIGMYQLLGKYARGFQMAAAAALLNVAFGLKHDDTPEEKEAKEDKNNIKLGANIVADFALSGLPAPYQSVVKIGANYAFSQGAKIAVKKKKAAAKQRGEKFDPRGTYLSPYFKPYYGVDGSAGSADFFSALALKAVDVIIEGANYIDVKDAVEDTESQKVSKQLNAYLGIGAMATGSGDLMLLNMRMQQILKETSKKEKKPSAGGGSARGGSRGRAQSSRSGR
jgi:polyhydroxyalkanoate synthesis regulator phasin